MECLKQISLKGKTSSMRFQMIAGITILLMSALLCALFGVWMLDASGHSACGKTGGSAIQTAVPVDDLAAMQAQAAADFRSDRPLAQGEPRQLAIFEEFQSVGGRAADMESVVVESSCGSVRIHPTIRDRVGVFFGKAVGARDYERARAYARELHYEVKRTAKKIVVKISRPADRPTDIAFDAVGCSVFAPSGVPVTVVSNAK